jgi:hypothetical protein
MNYKELECEECCYTCLNNRNNLNQNYPCNCKFENRKDNTKQDMWCKDYEMIYNNE